MSVSLHPVVGIERNIRIKSVKLSALFRTNMLLSYTFSFSEQKYYFMDHIDLILWATFTKSVISFAEIFNVEIIKINNPTILKKYILVKKGV